MGTKEIKRDWALDNEKPTELDQAVEFLNNRPHLQKNGQIDRYAIGRIMLEWASQNASTSDEALPIGGVMRSRLSPGDKLICWAKGAAYGDTFTVQDPMYEEGMILQCDKYGSWSPLKDVDLSEFDYA